MIKTKIFTIIFCAISFLSWGETKGQIIKEQCAELPIKFPGEKKDFHGFDMYVDNDRKVVVPHKVAAGNPWVWRARFFGYEPQFDIAMLKRGYYVVYCDVAGLFGSPKAVAKWNEFYKYLRSKYNFSKKVILAGVSRGGLIVYNWAIQNPNKVKAIYCDLPVMDFRSWPGGQGKSKQVKEEWKRCLKSYGLTDSEAREYNNQPINNLEPLAKAGIPIIHVVGDADETVPVDENTAIAEKNYKALGGVIKVIHQPNRKHQPHDIYDPSEIVEFILQHITTNSCK